MVILFVSAGIYLVVVGFFFIGWLRLKPFAPDSTIEGKFISVLVPVCNEQANIANFIHDLTLQNYPAHLFEIIVIDDHSDDNSRQIIGEAGVANLKLLALPAGKYGKKQALALGLGVACGEIIVTTDADCRFGPGWLNTIAQGFQQYNPHLLLLPVVGIDNHTFFGRCQQLELYSLLGSTAGAAAAGQPVMCNGANLAYSRAVTPLVSKVYSDTAVVSGDDIFTLLEIKKMPSPRIIFLKTLKGAVATALSPTVKTFYRQRQRWVSKAKYYSDPGIILAALAVLQLNILLLVFFISGVCTGHFSGFLLLLLLKSLVDFPFLLSVTSFFGDKKLMFWFPVVQGFYFFYVCITVFRGLAAKPRWKKNPRVNAPATG